MAYFMLSTHTENAINKLLADLDAQARNYDREYGLPVYDFIEMQIMHKIVYKWLKTLKKGPDGSKRQIRA